MGKTRDLFKKIRDTKGTFYAKMGTIKDRNGMDLTEAEDIKKRSGKHQFSFQSLRKAMPKNAQTIAQLYSSHTLVMIKILQARFQQYVNHELPEVQAGFRKGRWTRNQIANIGWVIEKAREFQKNIYFCFIDYVNPWTIWTTINSGKFLKTQEYQTTWPASLETCMQEATIRTGHGTTD